MNDYAQIQIYKLPVIFGGLLIMRIFCKERRRETRVPLLRNTFIAKFMPAELIYRGIDDYIRASKNDVDQESQGLTDIDKVINHGFDKRTSFRNIKD